MDEPVLDWAPPGPGPWQQDSAHMPAPMTAAMQELFPIGFNRGFAETFARYGLLLDGLAMGVVHGFSYHQPQPFDLPGPDGPPDPALLGAEIGRRAQLAEQVFATRLWRQDLEAWDTERRPAAIARHRQLADVDLAALDGSALAAHLAACRDHLVAMVHQHHRHNMAAMLPVGEFLLQVGTMLGRPPGSLLGVLDGHSPISGIHPPEILPAVAALRRDAAAAALLDGDGDAAQRLAALRDRLPEVDEYVRSVGFRLVEGFDLCHATTIERPDIVLGKLAAAMRDDPGAGRARADELAAELRAEVPEEHRGTFDELLAEARLVYRLRDERGIYSDVSAVGLLRWALLEAGRRCHRAGTLHDPADMLDATVDEAIALVTGDRGPTADELAARGERRRRLSATGAPRHLGPPPPAPPPLDQLPPALARLMAATGLLIDGVLGQLDQPAGDGPLIGGIAASAGTYEGRARLVASPEDLFRLEAGDVLVTPATGEAVCSVLHLLGAIVTDHGSFACHAGIVGREMGIPAVVGTVNGTRRIADGARIRVDGSAGVVTLLG